ncbi:MAG: hypothetical protein M4579_003336 [Chaenotheca gracillima]|nr:MAG: hypothetical protein M4579_003336 [Chaenotheca gracillima]
MANSAKSKNRIDVHHHAIPPFYREALESAGGDPSGWHLPPWSLDLDGSFSDSQQIKTAILSLTAPGSSILEGAAETQLARKTNEYVASIRDGDPSNHGFFATVPSLMNKKDALEEIEYALDVLHADGVTLFTRYGKDNHYLGHAHFKEIWDELDRRAAVVFIHPTHPVDTTLANSHLYQPLLDYPHETTRAAVDMIINDVVRDHPQCKIILSHAGGTLPYLVTRAATALYDLHSIRKTPDEFIEDARTFYYDLAVSGNKWTLNLLSDFAKPDHILFGSDFPFAPVKTTEYSADKIDSHGFSEETAYEINRGNALRLFPRLR